MVVSDQPLLLMFCPLRVKEPAVLPKLVPEMVNWASGSPLAGVRLLIFGAKTVKLTPLLDSEPAVTITLPLLAPFGTFTPMLVFDQVVIAALSPLNLTVPVVEVKLLPLIVIDAPGSPLVAESELITGATVNRTPLLARPAAVVTTTFPVVALPGTVAVMLVADQFVTAAAVPLKVTVPVLAPNVVPAITMEFPPTPLLGVRLVIAGVTVKDTALL
jgi:hypothetical protein